MPFVNTHLRDLKCKGYFHFFTQDTTQQTKKKRNQNQDVENDKESEKCKLGWHGPSIRTLAALGSGAETPVVHRQRLSPAEEELIRGPLLVWKGSVRTGHRGRGVGGGQKGNSSSDRTHELGSSSKHSGWDRYGLFVSDFYFSSIVSRAGLGWGCVKGEGCSDEGCILGPFPPCDSTLTLISLSTWRQPAPATQAAPLLCSTLFRSEEPRPGPQTGIHVCLYGPGDVMRALSGLSHWPCRSPACWGEK